MTSAVSDGGSAVERVERSMEELRHATFGLFGPAVRVQLQAQLGWEWSATHYRLLRVVEATDPLRPTIGELGAALLADKARASRLVSQLQSAGLVRRVTGRLDRRRREVELTDEGRQVLARARRLRVEYYAEVLGGWPDAQVEILAGSLERLNDCVRRRSFDQP
jgi:DNA-binding MarR family transcriptional regulator